MSFLGLQSACWDCFTLIVFLLSCRCLCFVSIPRGAMVWSVIFDCGISLLYPFVFMLGSRGVQRCFFFFFFFFFWGGGGG